MIVVWGRTGEFRGNRVNRLGLGSVGIGYQDVTHSVPVRETGQCERRAAILDLDVSPVCKADRAAAFSDGLEFDTVSTGWNLETQDLDLIGKQTPTTRVGGLDGLPGDARDVEQQAGGGCDVQGVFNGINSSFLDNPTGHRASHDVGQHRLMLLDRDFSNVRDGLGFSEALVSDLNRHAGNGVAGDRDHGDFDGC